MGAISIFKRLFIIGRIFTIVNSLFIVSACGAAYHGHPSDHFDGKRFFNPEPDYTFKDMVKWFWEMETVDWPDWFEDPRQPPPVERVSGSQIRVTYINHATILIQMNGLNILTDPIWSCRASPISWMGPKRVRAPGVSMDNLPKIDYVLISHDHYDHLDLASLTEIVRRDSPTVLTGLGVKGLLTLNHICKVVEMDWWDTHATRIPGVDITFVPSRHNSGRKLFSKNKTLWGGFVIGNTLGQVYYAGDTAFGEFINLIKKRFDRILLSLLPIGSYEKRWFMKTQHINPDEAVQIHKLLNSHQSMGFHYSTFNEHPEQTIDAHEEDLATALKKYNIPPSRFWVLNFGESKEIQYPGR